MVQFSKFLSEKQEIDLSKVEDPVRYAKSVRFNRELEFSKSLVLDLVTKSSQAHELRFRPFMVRYNMLVSIMKLQSLNSKLLNLQIVRLYKQMIKNKEETLVRFLNKIGMHDSMLSLL